jgi:hypothetical protein
MIDDYGWMARPTRFSLGRDFEHCPHRRNSSSMRSGRMRLAHDWYPRSASLAACFLSQAITSASLACRVIPKAPAFTSGRRDLAWTADTPARDPSLRLKSGFVRDDATPLCGELYAWRYGRLW